jgi:hypothetical protein
MYRICCFSYSFVIFEQWFSKQLHVQYFIVIIICQTPYAGYAVAILSFTVIKNHEAIWKTAYTVHVWLSVSIITIVVSSHPTHSELYSIHLQYMYMYNVQGTRIYQCHDHYHHVFLHVFQVSFNNESDHNDIQVLMQHYRDWFFMTRSKW